VFAYERTKTERGSSVHVMYKHGVGGGGGRTRVWRWWRQRQKRLPYLRFLESLLIARQALLGRVNSIKPAAGPNRIYESHAFSPNQDEHTVHVPREPRYVYTAGTIDPHLYPMVLERSIRAYLCFFPFTRSTSIRVPAAVPFISGVGRGGEMCGSTLLPLRIRVFFQLDIALEIDNTPICKFRTVNTG
jgi:hypothetical protein